MTWTIFRTIDKYYLYDRNINEIVEIGPKMFEMLEDGNISEASEKASKLGLLQKSPLKKISHPFNDIIIDFLSEKMEQIVLQVTQNCNLRCSYCAYTESSQYSNRSHQNKFMTFKTAKAGIDFLMCHSRGVPEVYVGFYGGEPLLALHLIQDVIHYVESTYQEKHVHYSLTTNGTLLTDETVDFLLSNQVAVTISLDGPKEYHDRNRKFADGSGSFDTILQNIARMKKRHPEYECRVNSVLTSDKDLACMENFLTGSAYLKGASSRLSFLTDTGLDDSVTYDEEILVAQRECELRQLLAAVDAIEYDSADLVFGDYVQEVSRAKEVLDMGPVVNTGKAHPAGVCLAGSKRAFLDVSGNFYPCEKVSEIPEVQIGSLDGFDVEKIRKLINIGKLTEDACIDCWAFLFCNQCVASIIGSKGISTKKRAKKCSITLQSAKEKLISYCLLKENGFDLNKYY